MTKKIYVWAILLAFVMQSMNVWSETSSALPVYLYSKHTPKLDGNPKPSKAPAYISLSVFLDEETKQLIITDTSNRVYTYSIYNENEEIISQGLLDCASNENLYIDLGNFQSGTYYIAIFDDSVTYIGAFELI